MESGAKPLEKIHEQLQIIMKVIHAVQLGTIVEFLRAKLLLPPNGREGGVC
jgi:hypothetical protein